MKRGVAAVCLILIIFSCTGPGERAEGYTVKGNVRHPGTGYVWLEILTPDGYEAVDSAKLDSKGNFMLKTRKKEPDIYRINFFENQKNPFVISGQDVWIEADGNTAFGGFKIRGGEGADALTRYLDLKTKFRVKLNALQQEIFTANDHEDSLKLDSLKKEAELLQQNFEDNAKEIIRSQNGNLTALLLLSGDLRIGPNLDFYDEQMPILKGKLSGVWQFEDLYKEYKKVKQVAVGSVAPDFTLPDPAGDSISLSSFRGKYLFIDFWASWCQPCRLENPNLKKVYEKYHGPQFDILGVAIEKKKKYWLEAIREDGLPWHHVSDLKYLDSEVIELYDITGVPLTILLDPEGRIIAKDLHSDELDSILSARLGK